MTPTEAAYMAGIIDGEGCVYVNRRKATGRRLTPGYSVKILVTTTDKPLVDWCIAHACLTSVYHNPNPEGNRKPKWLCTWNNSAAEWLIEQTYQYLVIKKRQAELGYQLMKHLKQNFGGTGKVTPQSSLDYRERIKLEISQLNQRGRN